MQNSPAEDTFQEHDWTYYQQQYQIEKVAKIHNKYHFRNFMNNFKSCVIQTLLKHTNNKPEVVYILQKPQDDWPYKALVLKKNKNQHEKLQFEFISMCAEKIQSVFKAHTIRRRHLIAYQRLKVFKAKALALLKGWKVRQVMRCLKIREEMKTIHIKQAEVAKEQRTLNETNNKYSIRKLQYLQKSLEDQIVQFLNKFNHLYSTGGWTFEPKVERSLPRIQKVQKWNKKIDNRIQKQQTLTASQTKIEDPIDNQPMPVLQPKQRKTDKPKRVREMRNKKPQKPLETSLNEFIQQELKPITSNNDSETSANTNTNQDRPIQAKGAYKIDQQNQHYQQNQLKLNQAQNNDQQKTDKTEKKTEAKIIDKKKLQKKQKYDPRKAVLQQKQKKKQLQQKLSKQPPKPIQTQPQTAHQIPHLQQKEKVQKQVKSLKNLKQTEKQQAGNRNTVVGASKVNKSKIQAKIDCWGNRKTVVKKLPGRQSNRSVNSIIELADNPSQVAVPNVKNYSDLITLEKIRNRIQQQERQKKSHIQEESNIQDRETQQMRKDRSSEMLKKVTSDEPKMLKAVSMNSGPKQKQRMAEEQRRKQIIYRPVQELEETYNNQYINRFQNLMPKLGLLAAARSAQKLSSIPVLPVKSLYVQKMMSENVISQKFWQTVSKMEKRVKQFIIA